MILITIWRFNIIFYIVINNTWNNIWMKERDMNINSNEIDSLIEA